MKPARATQDNSVRCIIFVRSSFAFRFFFSFFFLVFSSFSLYISLFLSPLLSNLSLPLYRDAKCVTARNLRHSSLYAPLVIAQFFGTVASTLVISSSIRIYIFNSFIKFRYSLLASFNASRSKCIICTALSKLRQLLVIVTL